MKIEELEIKDLLLITEKKIVDNRGNFIEKYNKNVFKDLVDINIDFIQDNEVTSKYGVLRGMHYQLPPFAQTKLIRVIKGEILDVVVDCRRKSSTFGKYFSIRLSSNNSSQLLVPKGLAHGYLSLSDECIVEFKVDNKYSPDHIQGFRYDDHMLKINWEFDTKDIIISSVDEQLGSFNELIYFDSEH